MKTLFLLIATLFVAPAFAQMTCTTYLGGVTDCWGAGGYNAEYRQYLGGTTSYYDNRGNSGTAQGYSTSRTVTVTPATGRALPVVPDVYLVPGGYSPDAPYGPTR